jgi:hypothetical protein
VVDPVTGGADGAPLFTALMGGMALA